MRWEVISDRQKIYLVIFFILGTATTIVRGIEAKQDLWLAIILAMLMTLVMCFIYGRIHYLSPNRTFSDVLEICFGKAIGRILCLLYVSFIFHLSTLIVVDLGFFLTTISFTETPRIVFSILAVLVSVYAIKSGIEVIARWSEFFLLIIIITVIAFVLLLAPEMNINNIQPMLSGGIKPILMGAFSAFSFPFAEIVVFLMLFKNFDSKKSPYRVYSIGLLISGPILILLGMVYLLVLGVNTTTSQHFPSHLATSRISIGSLIQRTEVVTDIISIIPTFTKLSLCLLAICIGISKIFALDDYRFIVTPIGLLIINLSVFLHTDIMNWGEWARDVWTIYALPFQVIIPIIVLIAAEVKKSRLQKKES